MEQNVSDLSTGHELGFHPGLGAVGDSNSIEENLLWELHDYQPSLDWFDIPLLQEDFPS